MQAMMEILVCIQQTGSAGQVETDILGPVFGLVHPVLATLEPLQGAGAVVPMDGHIEHAPVGKRLQLFQITGAFIFRDIRNPLQGRPLRPEIGFLLDDIPRIPAVLPAAVRSGPLDDGEQRFQDGLAPIPFSV